MAEKHGCQHLGCLMTLSELVCLINSICFGYMTDYTAIKHTL